MPRSKRRYYAPLIPSSDSFSEDNSSSELDNHDEISGDESVQWDHFDNDENNQNEERSDLFRELHEASDEVITFLGSACLARSSDSDFRRFLSSHDEAFRSSAERLWKNESTHINKHYICNGCGNEMRRSEKCCGPIICYLRTGVLEQLKDIVNHHMAQLLEIRRKLRSGEEMNHNLTGSYLRKLWESEKKDILHLSLVASLDGVSLSGNTSQKIWPITLLLVDIPTAQMQRASNLAIHGLAEGPVNPSTFFYNTVVPMIYADIEGHTIERGEMKMKFFISTWIGDQPAKRALFGMKGCNSEGSCFFGECTGTFHKRMGHSRELTRPDEMTEEDARNGRNGFGPVTPKIIEFLYPYDTLIDLLHNASEGIFPVLMNEMLGTNRNIEPRSDLFSNDCTLQQKLCQDVVVPQQFQVSRMSNGSEKLTFFRISFGLAALVNPTLKPEARLVIASLMLITNQLYTDAPMPDCFHSHLTGAARWFLEKASPTYMSTKAHELLSHLPSVITKFGNIATLSTFSFEHYYKYCLKGFNPQKTNGFTSAAISRVILHSSVRREIELRSACNPSPSVIRFLKETPSLSVHRTTWKDPIVQLDREHDSDEIHEYELFGTLNLSIGRLKSYYVQKNTKDDVFFASTASGGHVCFRFLAACVKGSSVKVYAQRVRSVCPAFESIRKESYELAHPANQYSYNVMTKLWRYGGIVDGTLTDERELLETSAIKGVGAYLQNGDSTIYLQVNGACIHH